MDNFDEIYKKSILLKEKLEKEIIEIDKLYLQIYTEIKKLFEIKHEKFLKKENELIEELQNEVTKIKEQLENNLVISNSIITDIEKINKGVKILEKEKEKNIFNILSYISKINTIKNGMNLLNQKLIKSLKIYFNKELIKVNYEEFYFNGIQTPKEIEIEMVNNNSFKISWKLDDINILNVNNKHIKYQVEIRKEIPKEKFILYYDGNENNCIIENLNEKTNYEIRICCYYNDLIGPWSEIKKFQTNKNINLKSLILKNEKYNKKRTICNWIDPSKNFEFKLLFRMSRDGANCFNFHRLCDNKGETLILFQTDKNYIFGAYSPLNWTSPQSGEYCNPNDNLTFLFSLNKMKKYKKISGNTLRAQKDLGPLFGNGTDLGIKSDMKSGWSNNGSFLKERDLTNGESSFHLSEMEVFQVITK